MQPDELTGLFDDLEQRAEGLAHLTRAEDAADMSRVEYAEVDLAGRLLASVGAEVSLDLVGLGRVQGTLMRSGRDCCLMATDAGQWLVSTGCLLTVRGLTGRALPGEMRPVTARLGMASALRGWAERPGRVSVVLRDGSRRSGVLARVGADFVELLDDSGMPEALPLQMIVALRAL